jgi:enoyl-[acyl-carrier protein] reductase II
MGTRFMTTKESPLHSVYKRLSMEKDVEDTLYSDRFDGLLCRIMKTDAAEKAIKKGLNLPAAFFNAQEIAKQLKMPFFKLFVGVLLSGWKNARQLAFMANGFHAIRTATEDGDTKQGVLPVGQVMGLLHDEPTVAELMERMVAEAKKQQQKLDAHFA